MTLCGNGSVGSSTKRGLFAAPANRKGFQTVHVLVKSMGWLSLNLTPLHLIHINDIIENIANVTAEHMDCLKVFFLFRR